MRPAAAMHLAGQRGSCERFRAHRYTRLPSRGAVRGMRARTDSPIRTLQNPVCDVECRVRSNA